MFKFIGKMIIMIDGFKLDVTYLKESELMDKFDPKITLQYSTAEIVYPYSIQVSPAIKIDIRKNSKQMRGSIHKHFEYITSNTSRNDTQFTYDNFKFAISDLNQRTGIEMQKTKIQNLEVGFNITTTFSAQNLVKNCIIVHNGKEPEYITGRNSKGFYRQFKSGECAIKIYDKGSEKLYLENLLRIELKYMKNRRLPQGISNLIDILNPINWGNLKDDLVCEFNKFYILDALDFNRSIISKNDYDILLKASNSKFWTKLKSANQNLSKKEKSALTSRSSRFRQRAFEVRNKYNLGLNQNEIEQKIRDIFPDLLRSHNVTFSPVDKWGMNHAITDSHCCYTSHFLTSF